MLLNLFHLCVAHFTKCVFLRRWRALPGTAQRKSGAIEPEKDAEGNEINPHIPQYMASAPWYLNAQGPGLKHQKNYKDKTIAQARFPLLRGAISGVVLW